MMKNLLLLFALFFLVGCNQEKKTSTSKTEATEADSTEVVDERRDSVADQIESADFEADPINAIRERVEYINTADLESKHYEFTCDEKMMVDYYYDDDEIVKIAIDFGTVGDVYAKEGYYYDEGKLIFVYEYTEGGPACEDCIEKHEYRTYIQDDEVIKHLKDKAEANCRKCNFSPKTRHYTLLSSKSEEEMKRVLCPRIKV